HALRNAQVLGVPGYFAGKAGAVAAPALGLAVLLPGGEQAAVDHGDAVGALLLERHVEHAAVLAGGRVLRLHGAAVGRGDHQAVQAQRHVVEVEQVVGYGGVDRDPRIGSGQYRLRGTQPGLVRGGVERDRERGQGDGQDQVMLHGGPPGSVHDGCDGCGSGAVRNCAAQGRTARLTAPSSLLPWALPACGAVAGQVKGILTSSRPPTSRAASTTRVYWPGARSLSCGWASVKDSACRPTGRVGPVTPSTGRSRLRPDLRHHWRRSGSHLVPWPSAVSRIWYHTARLATTWWSAPSSQMATYGRWYSATLSLGIST